MSNNIFPPLALSEWAPTRNSLRIYAQVIGKVRRALTPPQKHWQHVSLRVAAAGLTTTPIPAGERTFEILLDCLTHQVAITTSRGERWQKPLRGQSPAAFRQELLAALEQLHIRPEIDPSLFTDTTPSVYDAAAVERFWQACSQIDAVFKQFKGELRQETGPVQIWPHHFDLALLWFSGRLVPGVDPSDEENADEQMNFGFSTGDEGIPAPYFYITAYPQPAGFTEADLPEDAMWHTDTFTGAVLMYESLVTADDPHEKLLTYLRTVQAAGARLMA